jgi:5-methylcytosine-specific restriction endonuclease McrA
MQTNVQQFTLLTNCTTDTGEYPYSLLNDITANRSETTTNMKRYRNTDQNGNNWSEAMIKTVWEKGNEIPGFDPDKYRKDSCGAWMQFSKFGYISENGVGWEIDHILPVSKGGTDDLNNLQPLQWQNNRSKGDEFPASDFAVIGSY